jgi:hypothetical protein
MAKLPVDGFFSSGVDIAMPDAARDFLLERTAGRRLAAANDAVEAFALAEDLEHLVVPLEHAGALIAHLGLGFKAYRTQWAGAVETLRSRFQSGVSMHTKVLTATWLVTDDNLTLEARTLLAVLSFFDSAPIPDTAFDALGPDLARTYRASLDDLVAVGYARRAGDGQSFSVQRMAQRLTRHSISAERVKANLTAALVWMDYAFDGDVQNPALRDRFAPLVPHVEQIVAAGEANGVKDPTAKVMWDLGRFIAGRDGMAAAQPWLARAKALA